MLFCVILFKLDGYLYGQEKFSDLLKEILNEPL